MKDSFSKKRGFPKHKKKYYGKDSFIIPQKFRINKKYVFIPKIGEVKWIKHRPIKGKIKHITIKQDGNDWYCSVCVELKIRKKQVKTDNIIGIDVGLKTFVTMSNGIIIENQKITKKYEKELRKASRKLSKRTKGGKNREKQQEKVNKIHKKIRNTRLDFQHKTTYCTITKCDGVVLENLNISGMMKNQHLAKAIADCAWFKFKKMVILQELIIYHVKVVLMATLPIESIG